VLRAVRVGESIPQRTTRMLHRERGHLVPVSSPLLFGQLTEIDARAELLERDRKHDRRHLIPDDAIDARLQRLRAPDGEMIPSLKYRREKRNSLDVIPMGMGEEDVGRYPGRRSARSVRAVAGDQRPAELADAGSRVEDDQPAGFCPHLHTWSVATVPHRVCSGSRDRTARPPEPQSQSHVTNAPRRQR